MARQWDRAIGRFCNTLELDPQYHWSHRLLGWSHIYTGRSEEAIRACETALQIGGRSAMTAGITGACYVMAGRTDEAWKLLDEWREDSLKTYVPPTAFAWIHGALEETDIVLDWLEKAVDESDGMVVLVPVHPFF